MKINSISNTFIFEDNMRFTANNFMLVVKDEDFPDKYIIPVLYINGNRLENINDCFLEKLVVIPHKEIKDKGLSRFNLQQIVKLSYGWIFKNPRYDENTNLPRNCTIDSHIHPIENNQIVEFFEGYLNEGESLFTPEIEFFQLIKEVYLETENAFFVIANYRLIGPFKALKVNGDSFKIATSSFKRFGEYVLDEKACIEIKVNELSRKLFFDCQDLRLMFKGDYDFISDDDLLKNFSSELRRNPYYFDKEKLDDSLKIIRKTLDESRVSKSKTNPRLVALLSKSEDLLKADIDLLKDIPQFQRLEEDVQEIKDRKKESEIELKVLKNEIDELGVKKDNIQKELNDLVQFKTEKLESEKVSLEADVEELEKRKRNLESEIKDEKNILESKLQNTKKEIDYLEWNKRELELSIKSLRGDFKKEQENAQKTLQDLIKAKIHFDFISGRDLSEQEPEQGSFTRFTVVDQFSVYFEFRNKIVEILKQHNRSFETHFVDNLLISIFQNTLTVFAGVPGTGKTSLARLLTNILAPKERIREVSVNRGWASQKDFIGFSNPLTKKFHASSTDIYSLLKQLDYEVNTEEEVSLYKNSPMAFILLDEANLSPLEHYWSSFYNLTDSSGILEVKLGHNETVRYPNNVRFIGTINYDHTTEELSPRVLDRINIIQLERTTKDLILSDLSNKEIESLQISFSKCIDFFNLNNPKSDVDEKRYINSYRLIKDEFQKLKIFISPRVEIAIMRYMNLALEYMNDENKPLDYCVAQRLLPLINLQGGDNRQKLESLKELLKDKKCNISAGVLEEIISLGSEKGIYEDNYNYFLTLSNV